MQSSVWEKLTVNFPEESNDHCLESGVWDKCLLAKMLINCFKSEISSSFSCLRKRKFHDWVSESQWSKILPFGNKAIQNSQGKLDLSEKSADQTSSQKWMFLPLPNLKATNDSNLLQIFEMLIHGLLKLKPYFLDLWQPEVILSSSC